MQKLFLIRHGETDYTLKGKYCGHNSISLNKRGIEQARSLRIRLRGAKIDKVYSSDLKRAVQTAGIIFEGRHVLKKKGLREIDFGRLCGLTYETTGRLYADTYKGWLKDPSRIKLPGGETMCRFAARVALCFEGIDAETKSDRVAIIAHGGTIRVILLKICGLALSNFWDIREETAALNIIEFNKKTPNIIEINDTSHLKKCFTKRYKKNG